MQGAMIRLLSGRKRSAKKERERERIEQEAAAAASEEKRTKEKREEERRKKLEEQQATPAEEKRTKEKREEERRRKLVEQQAETDREEERRMKEIVIRISDNLFDKAAQATQILKVAKLDEAFELDPTPLGQGQMSTLFHARKRESGEWVMLKIFNLSITPTSL